MNRPAGPAALAGLLLALLLVPAAPASASAGPVDLALPETLRFSEAFLVSGALDAELRLNDPVFVEPTVAFTAGTLTACPVDDPGDLLETLSFLTAECDGGITYRDPGVAFGPDTRIRTAGTHPVTAMPQAGVAAVARDGALAWLPAGPATLSAPDGHRFASADGGGSVLVVTRDRTDAYNGTEWAFLHDATASSWHGPTGSLLDAPASLAVGRAGRDALDGAGDPFRLLDVQELLYGTDGRDPRTDLADLVREFGRVGTVVDGALYGHLNGTVDGQSFSPDAVSLVRVDAATLAPADGRLTGDAEARLAVSPEGVRAGDGRVQSGTWVPALVLWFVVLAVGLVRRHPTPADARRRWANRGSALATLLLVDLYVVDRLAGVGLVTGLTTMDAPAALTVAVVDVVLLLVVLVHVAPLRRLGRSLLPADPERPRPWLPYVTDGGAWTLPWLAVLVWPGAFLALAYAFVRL